VAEFSPAYETEIIDQRRDTAWFEESRRLARQPRTYRWLDAAQLIKHAFGLAYTFPGRPITLLYLFWEPLNSEDHPIFAEHRTEVAQFGACILGGGPDFAAMSYTALWAAWDSDDAPAWLPAHVRRLRTRYLVSL
jgi:hypothetical protein